MKSFISILLTAFLSHFFPNVKILSCMEVIFALFYDVIFNTHMDIKCKS